ncbi:MAG: translation elongation factor EF-1 subunit alpha [Thermoplasmatales archaeon]
MATQKPHLNLVTIGHVDHGKSTTVGRLLYEHGEIPAHIIEEYKKEAEEKGKATFEFAWVMDRLKEERERGVTIDVAHRKFETDKYYFTLIDAPGHRDFVKNMITGTSQADAALLVVSAREGEGVMAQTREHVFLARTLGVPQMIVLINKMDATQPPYSQQRFEEVKKQVEQLLISVGYKNVPMVPISGYKGDNIMKKSPNMPWWTGPTLLDLLNQLTIPPKPTEKPLRLPVQDVYSITGIGTVPVGRVETGILKVGDNIIFEPSHKTGEVKSIEEHHESIPQAEPGDNIGFNVRGISKTDIRRGDVAGHVTNPPTVVSSFTGQIVVLNHPSVIAAGYTPVFHAHTAQVACTITEIIKTIDPRQGTTKEDHPQHIKTGDAAVVKIVPTKPMVIEKMSDFPPLARFAVRDMGQTVAAGQCIDLEKKSQ